MYVLAMRWKPKRKGEAEDAREEAGLVLQSRQGRLPGRQESGGTLSEAGAGRGLRKKMLSPEVQTRRKTRSLPC